MVSADADIKNATLAYQDLPLTTANGQYAFRYRILSNDNSAVSEWSPIQKVTMPTLSSLFFPTITNSTVSGSSGTVTVTTATEHKFSTGDLVTISGVAPIGYNQTNASITVVNSKKFTYANATTTTPITATGTSSLMSFSATRAGGTGSMLVTSSWTVPNELSKVQFDVFYRYTNGSLSATPYIYHSTVDAQNVSIGIPSGINFAQIWVQAAVSPKAISTVTKIFESSTIYMI
jgi:hypothetical protein